MEGFKVNRSRFEKKKQLKYLDNANISKIVL